MNTMHILDNDRRMLRELGKKVADIASLPINGIRKDLWRRVNGLEKVKPPICIYEIPWNEMDVDGELELKTTDPMCRQIEWELRETLYRRPLLSRRLGSIWLLASHRSSGNPAFRTGLCCRLAPQPPAISRGFVPKQSPREIHPATS